MQRRELLARALALVGAVPAALVLTSCSGEGGDPDANFQTSFQTTSETNTSGHLHTITVMCADLGGGDVLYTTSEAANHTHAVTFTRADLATIAGGQTLVKSITDQGHDHTWNVTKPPTAC